LTKRSETRGLLGGAWNGLEDVWSFRNLLYGLVVRDLKVKYQRSLLGLLWTLLNPLLTSLLLIAVFSYVIRIQIDHYWAFLLSGYFVWNFIQQALSNGAIIMSQHATLRRSVAFPSEILIISVAASKLVEFLIGMSLVLGVVAVFHHQGIPLSFALFPIIVLIQVILLVGLMYPIATVSVLFHDFQHALPIVIFTLFYITPIFYPVGMVPEILRPYYFLNPFAGLLTLYHIILYEGQWPSITLLGVVFAVAIICYLIGCALFNRYKYVCVEIA
jgi:lipopolysaccharide transport system permease protein